jgi:hypothetical protein
MSNALTPDAEPVRLRDLRCRLEKEIGAMEIDFDEVFENATDSGEVIARLVRSALTDEEIASSLQDRMSDLEVEYDDLEERAEAKRKLALLVMLEAGIQHLELSGLTVDVRRSDGEIDILDEDLIPNSFRIPQPGWIDYQKVGAALKQGKVVPGAVLDDGEPRLHVRVT